MSSLFQRPLLGALLAASALAGCAALPASGPSSDAIVAGSEVATDQGAFARYELIEVDPALVNALSGRPQDSLLASFGDNRRAAEPVIGVGDVVSVTVWEAGSGGLFSGPLIADRFSAGSKSALIPEQVVGRDGSITIPYAGRLRVLGKRTQDVQALVEKELAGKAIEPQVLVAVTQPVSNSVTVIGEAVTPSLGFTSRAAQSSALLGGASLAGAAGAGLGTPGRIPISGSGDRLLDVIATAGGMTGAVHETFVRLSRGNATVTVPMTTVVSNPRENIFVRAGDIITLVRDPQTFVATGATGANFEIPFSAEGITLSQGLAKARGLSELQADPAGVFVFRFEPESVVRRLRPGSPLLASRSVPVVYRINMRDPNSLFLAQGFKMRNRDVLYVSNAPAVELQKALGIVGQITAPAANAATTYLYLR
jgi:polysaccharide biosynthesis/export protein